MWLVAGTGGVFGTFGIFVLFTPPDDSNMPMDQGLFVLLTITFFLLALAVPFVVYALRKPGWKNPDLDDVHHESPMDF